MKDKALRAHVLAVWAAPRHYIQCLSVLLCVGLASCNCMAFELLKLLCERQKAMMTIS